MIQIIDKHKCCGCSSCAQRCPKRCITMKQDEEGFLYPQIDAFLCIDCGLCEKVCPLQNPKQAHEPIKIFASKNPDEAIRKKSSSGGIFSMLAENVIREGGVVFGALWDENWNVKNSYTEVIEGLEAFRSSKYVQSSINESYQNAESFLKANRQVLFSGTPCQIAGLKAFLHKEYDNLLTVECACHGVPSSGLWQKYLSEITKGKSIVGINHRDKRTGWRNYSVIIQFADGNEITQAHDNNPWTRAFIKNLTLRPSCHQCAFKIFKSQADVTIADLWGDRKLMPDQDEDKGITLVVVSTLKATKFLKDVKIIKSFTLQEVVPFNDALVIPPKHNPKRSEFMSRIQSGEPFSNLLTSLTKDSLILRIKLFIRRFV